MKSRFATNGPIPFAIAKESELWQAIKKNMPANLLQRRG